ncbi:MAG: hypothetical protein IJD64_00430, partial [Clostridia bacterium]|nr:hypothetical protein [Clostridia bacterium]
IVLIVILCIAALIVRFGNFGGRTTSDRLESYDVYFSVTDIVYTSEDAFVPGDTVTLVDKGIVLGELVGLESILPAEFVARDKSGNLIVVNYPESTRIDVTGKIVSQGNMTDNGYLVGGTTYVASGTKYSVQTEHMDFVLTITDIVEK